MNKKRLHKIKRASIYFIFAIGLVVSIVTLFLRSGIHIDEISFADVKVKDCSFGWDQGGYIEIQKLVFNGETISFPIPYREIESVFNKGVKYFSFLEPFLTSITIQSFETSMVSGELTYSQNSQQSGATIDFTSSFFSIHSSLTHNEQSVDLVIHSFSSSEIGVAFTGIVNIDLHSGIAAGALDVDVAQMLPVNIHFKTDSLGVSFSGTFDRAISEIKPIVDLFQLDPDITPWISEYLKGSSYKLQEINGRLLWKDPMSLLTSFYAKGRVDEAQYAFAEGFEHVKSAYTDVVFEDSILKIYPHQPLFYGQECGEKSWLDIDFTDPLEPVLSVYLFTTAVLNKDLLNLIAFYDVDIPVEQISGSTVADLTISVNLQTEEVEAEGDFIVGPGVINFMDMDLTTSGGKVHLKNALVDMKDFLFSIQDIVSSKLNGKLDASNDRGALDFEIQKINYDTGRLALKLSPDHKPLTVRYAIHPNGDTIKSSTSTWLYGKEKFILSAFTAPFDFDKLFLKLPPISLKNDEQGVEALFHGNIDIQNFLADLTLDLKKYNNNMVALEETPFQVKLSFDGTLHITSEEKSRWSVQGQHATLYPFAFSLHTNKIELTRGGWEFDDIFKSDITGHFDTETGVGQFLLNRVHLQNAALGTILSPSKHILMEVGKVQKDLFIRIPELETFFQISPDKSWTLFLRDFEPFIELSPLLDRVNVTSGHFNLSSENGGFPISLNGKIFSPYSLLKENGNDQDIYDFEAQILENGFSGDINKSIFINYSNGVEVITSEVSFNVQEIISCIEDLVPDNTESKDVDFDFKLTATNSALHLRDGNMALADSLYLNFEDGNTLVQIRHGKGSAWLSYFDDNLYFSGSNFNEEFIEGLLKEARFSGGRLSFSGRGTLDDLKAHFQIDETVLVNFGLVNNIFAFVDTIPALITFSLPSYRGKGMAVSSAVLNFNYSDSLFAIDNFAIKSKNLNMFGTGEVSLVEDTIDMDINLITTAKENISKIPLVGYVLVGDERLPSITLKVTGNPGNPNVASSAFKDYLSWPVETVFRAIKLPFGILDKIFSQSGTLPKDGESIIETPGEAKGE